jgi:DNA-binding NtrC family response regulator
VVLFPIVPPHDIGEDADTILNVSDRSGTSLALCSLRRVVTELNILEHSTVSPISILVVDDEKLIRWSLRERLEQAGYQVVVAESAEQTLQNLNERVSLALLDVKLPDMGGIELLHEIRHRCPQCRVIMMTAQWSPELADEAARNGAVDVLRKPFDLDDMARVVATTLA